MKKRISLLFCTLLMALSLLSLVACFESNSTNNESNVETIALNYNFCRYVSSSLYETNETGGKLYGFENKYGGLGAQLYKGGGTIKGKTQQTVVKGEYGAEVTAVADEGYEFIKWSDGLTSPSRKDTSTYRYNIVDSARYNQQYNEVYPLFAKKHTVTFKAMTGGYIIGETTQTIATGKSGTQLTAVAEEGYIFMGWYHQDNHGMVAPGSYSGRITISEALEYDPFLHELPRDGQFIVAAFYEARN